MDPAIDVPDMEEELRLLLKQIPKGCVSTYGDLASALGSKTAARWVGEYMVGHVHERGCRCHRVVRSTGDIGLYWSRNADDKVAALEKEGITVDHGFVNLDEYRFDQFRCSAPLVALEQRQFDVADQVRLKQRGGPFKQVGGLDVSYLSPQEAVGAYCLVDSNSGELVWSITVEMRIRFPYISGFLAYRELPVHRRLIEKARSAMKLAKVILVDGNGILHPRRAGIATHLGVEYAICTIGIGKTLICGKLDNDDLPPDGETPIRVEDEIVGKSMRNRRSKRKIFVSPGHQIDVLGAAKVARNTWFDHKLPEPIYLADAISRACVKRQKG